MKLPEPVVSTIENPSDNFLFNRELVEGDLVHRCPVCRHEFSHVQAAYTLLGGDESDGLYRGCYLVARETPYRRDALAIRIHGECGHRWDFVFQQQEGCTLVRIDVLKGNFAGVGLAEWHR